MARSGRVVVAAALIMAAVFGGFIFNADPIIKSIGFALTIGVLIDAFVVRMTLVPAVMALLGRHAWSLPRLARPDRAQRRHGGRGTGTAHGTEHGTVRGDGGGADG